jgi:hypothetical protein
MDMKEIGYQVLDWIYEVQDKDHKWAFVTAMTNLQVLQKKKKNHTRLTKYLLASHVRI